MSFPFQLSYCINPPALRTFVASLARMCQHHYLSPAVSVLTKPEPAEEPLTLWFLTPHNSMGSDDLIVIPRPKTPPFSASSLLLSATIATEPVKPERRIQTSPTNLIEAPSKDPYRGFKLEILPPLGTVTLRTDFLRKSLSACRLSPVSICIVRNETSI